MLGNIEDLSAKGVSFAMDDFGTDFSNLAMLANVPYDYIKFDKSLVWMAFEDVPDDKKVGMLEDMIRLIVCFGKKDHSRGNRDGGNAGLSDKERGFAFSGLLSFETCTR